MLTYMLAQAAADAATKQPVMSMLDVVLFCVAVVGVIGLGIYKARPEKSEAEAAAKKDDSAADYFLAGRGLSWWLVGFSLIAANISTEQFVGTSGQAADWLGLAIASYEWLAAITLVVVAFFFLPKLLRCGVYTIPEFLESRFNLGSRAIMAVSTIFILVGVPTAGVIYSGAKVIAVFFFGPEGVLGLDFNNLLNLASLGIDSNILVGCLIIAFCGSVYVYVGGLKACAWTDLIWGAGLILGGGVVAYLALRALGAADAAHLLESASANSPLMQGKETLADAGGIASGWERFLQLNAGDVADGMNTAGGKLHMVRPSTDSAVPWTALCLGLWIPNFFYWGLNQYIMQRTLASKSVAEGQMGIVFAAFLKLLIPFVVIIPGILAYNLYRGDLKSEAERKNDVAIKSIEESGTQAKTIYFVTGEFLLQHNEKGRELVAHNVSTAIKNNLSVALPAKIAGEYGIPVPAGEDAISVPVQTVAPMIERAFDQLDKDVANTSTTLSQRIPFAQNAADLNKTIVDAAKTSSTADLDVSQKLVGFDYDAAFPTLLKNLMSPGITWFVLAALFGAVVSSLASMLNSASTIFTMDIYNKLRKNASAKELVGVGKIGVLVCVLIALALSPFLGSPAFGGIFTFIQEFQGFISPGVLSVFLFGFFVPKCPRVFGWLGIVLNAVLYGALKWFIAPEIAFLNRMSICLGVCVLVGAVLTIWNAARGGEAIVVPQKNEVPLEGSGKAKAFAAFVVVATVVLYAVFW